MLPIRLSAANSHDLNQLNELMFQLHHEHHQQSPEHFKTAEEIEQEKSIARYLDDPECFVFVARFEETLVGFVSGHFCELVSSVSKPVPMGSIDELYVLPAYRKQGIAIQLCQRIERSFKECGVEQMFVEVWHFNDSAVELYKNLGFEHHIHWLRKSIRT
ncbi:MULTISPECIES: GNAT family N-acetyltransferase [Vibrio]|uniref:Putative acetyltransferase n=1 Tax=Vibrio proteolyticus NBRC 13287 TaxID=1219065 RepID=U3BLY2_VIBPR|nr:MULTISPECIES: GNAT family N-acetyltransferase [Vibrio]NAW59523.1 GNAT family N-acetyltransferase [Vibrio sp. V36_P2S2PM302]NAX20582.1 GNAT family N-acetyltransferase [Vibrio sp. V39_P1S14PM300]NAX24259.1 GNAT family N-acetyltransferase [Vibrio sp. V38_P2S17PM301]NAX29040.1 GNAT family N-acetyltransferase [Vibrio sp. V37_P2S8PM304]GAD67618.1 putative acetyltransferase [Vibrio proteolyticus NBRC 13287]